eukprot:TRINITY_DN107434_c0_g1_i1.p1 TRINITY_DN107434_c0_g1~~TRINITY_DN107434_c0_g1_i1.p1  ORF type:complete len:262 (+),score=15.92 TRINITY_DN107434_c0_g1_i1:36-821(+)
MRSKGSFVGVGLCCLCGFVLVLVFAFALLLPAIQKRSRTQQKTCIIDSAETKTHRCALKQNCRCTNDWCGDDDGDDFDTACEYMRERMIDGTCHDGECCLSSTKYKSSTSHKSKSKSSSCKKGVDCCEMNVGDCQSLALTYHEQASGDSHQEVKDKCLLDRRCFDRLKAKYHEEAVVRCWWDPEELTMVLEDKKPGMGKLVGGGVGLAIGGLILLGATIAGLKLFFARLSGGYEDAMPSRGFEDTKEAEPPVINKEELPEM